MQSSISYHFGFVHVFIYLWEQKFLHFLELGKYARNSTALMKTSWENCQTTEQYLTGWSPENFIKIPKKPTNIGRPSSDNFGLN